MSPATRFCALGLLLGLGALAGCAIPGRGTLGPAPQAPQAAALAQAHAEYGRVAYVTIPAHTQPMAYRGPLASAIQAAEARKPDVIFDVVAAVPQVGTPLDQITAAKRLGPDAEEVARSIRQDGVPEARITLGAAIQAGIKGEEIRIYVR
jgi:hypothetical protein